MITLFTLYTIIENRQHYVDEFNGFYLGHDETKVMFGYIHPSKSKLLYIFKLRTLETIHLNDRHSFKFTYNSLRFLTKSETILFKIPSLDDITFIKNSLGPNRKINLSCWLKNYDTQKLFIYESSYKGENLLDNVLEETAPILLIRYVDILK